MFSQVDMPAPAMVMMFLALPVFMYSTTPSKSKEGKT